MEDIAIKKDEAPYLIFPCANCHQYAYVKKTRKTKKCLRCGRNHQVRDILKIGEVVYGMTEAVNTVKRKQNELAIPEFRSDSDFVVHTAKHSTHSSNKLIERPSLTGEDDHDLSYKREFTEMLIEISKLYKRFPIYMLEIMAENYGIPSLELKILINNAKKSGMLIKNNDNYMYYRYQVNKF